MRAKDCPCHGCTERRLVSTQTLDLVRCHSVCERYKAYRKQLDLAREAERKREKADQDYRAFRATALGHLKKKMRKDK